MSGSTSKLPRIYLAGPDVFLRNPLSIGKQKKTLCEAYGFEGVFPLDNEINPENLSPSEIGMMISNVNQELIRSCQIVIANMTPFRGVSADVGTVFEMGFACALGLKVFAYTNVSMPYTQRVETEYKDKIIIDSDDVMRDDFDMSVENFSLMDNLMLEGGISASGGILVVDEAPIEERFTYLGGFEKCLQIVKDSIGQSK